MVNVVFVLEEDLEGLRLRFFYNETFRVISNVMEGDLKRSFVDLLCSWDFSHRTEDAASDSFSNIFDPINQKFIILITRWWIEFISLILSVHFHPK